jgi:thiamine biosynthesis lipoprotein
MTAAADVHRYAHAAMATTFEVRCVHPEARYARQAAEAAFALVERLEQEQSRFIANSDVARINELQAGAATRVSPQTMECLEIAQRMYEITGGAFDVSLGTGLDRLDLLVDDLAVVAREAGARLDLGGIGKGYAVDRVAELLLEWDVPRALVHGGWSSVVALEPPPDADGWSLTLSAPDEADPRVLVRLSARQKALSASGTRKGDHILDPHTGAPVARRAVWVGLDRGEGEEAGSPAAVAETLSTAFMVLTSEQAAEVCRFAGVEAWIFEQDLLVHLTSGARADKDAS